MEENKQQPEVAPVGAKTKIFHRTIQTASILVLFACVAVLISGWINKFLTAGLTLTLCIFIIVSLGAILSLPWIAKVRDPKQRVLSIVLLSLIGGSALLWVISAIFIYLLYKNSASYQPGTITFFLNFIRFSLIISFQAIEANMISLSIMRYKKQYIAFQAVMYASYLFVDFWVSIVIGGVKFSTTEGVSFSPILPMLFGAGMITILVIAIIYIIISSAIINSIEARKNGEYYTRRGRRNRGPALTESIIDSFTDIEDIKTAKTEEKSAETKPVSTEEKLAKLKDLLDKNLITEEEYNKKKEKILEEM